MVIDKIELLPDQQHMNLQVILLITHRFKESSIQDYNQQDDKDEFQNNVLPLPWQLSEVVPFVFHLVRWNTQPICCRNNLSRSIMDANKK